VLTASGGPFRERGDLSHVRPEDALAHPVWEMGAKITVDSATLMNKGLELIEAHHLFGLAYDQLEIVVHPQSTIHALVRLEDGSLLAHAGPPDMRVPIALALRHPAAPPPRAPFDLVGLELTFEAPDTTRFPCLALARRAGVEGGTAPAALNAANEVAVGAFLGGRLPFTGIPEVVETVLEELPVSPADDLETVLEVDARAREIAERRCGVAVGGAA
jgi:1-deoxy-D-xylulose-5-phosphate reductoisomerase